MATEWFEEWFDTKYYHILYKSRDEKEANAFIEKIILAFEFKKDWKYCDMACGKGRHSIFLNSKGFEVTGLDLSPNNICHAEQFENERLSFFEHDIREVYEKESFDVMLNLFTSFGYFENNEENQKAIQAMAESIKSGGLLLIDYMNSRKAIEEFSTHYVKAVEGIDFYINKKIEKGYVFKNISFSDGGVNYKYEERVKLLYLDDFESFFKNSKLKIEAVYGDYNLNSYDEHKSDRMVMACRKN